MIRAREIVDDGRRVVLRAAVHSSGVLSILEGLRPNNFNRREVRLTWAGRSVPVRVTDVTTTTTASRSTGVVIEMERGDAGSGGSPFGMTASFGLGATRYTSDDLAVLDMRRLLFGEDLPAGLRTFGGSVRDFTVDLPAETVPTALYQAVFALLVTEALVESGRAIHVESAQVSPLGPGGRRVRIAWLGHTDHGGALTHVNLEGLIPTSP